MYLIIIAALVFGLCFLTDLLFRKVFRNKRQHLSGAAVRLNKRYGTVGILMAVIGIAALFSGLPDQWLLLVGGGIMVVTGLGLCIYYLIYGIYYDKDGFLYSRLLRKSLSYPYKEIRGQMLYASGSSVMIELYMNDGKTVALQSTMAGAYTFMDTAFAGWLKQTGKSLEDCSFYDPDNSCWFPPVEA